MKVTIRKIVSSLVLVGVLGFSACNSSLSDYTIKQLLTILDKSETLKANFIQAIKNKNTKQMKSINLEMEKIKKKIEPFYKSAKKADNEMLGKIYANLNNEKKEKELKLLSDKVNRKRYTSLAILDNIKEARENK